MESTHHDQPQPQGPETGASPGAPGTDQEQRQVQAGPPPYYQAPPRKVPTKSSVAAGILSGIMPGLGQIYVGYYQLGFIYVLIFAATIVILSSSTGGGMEPLFGIFLAFFYLYNIIDAVRRAAFYNQVMEGTQAGNVPQDFRMPGPQGSMLGGVILVVLGGLAFLETKFDVSMEWLEEWWPLGAVILGVYLIYKSRQSSRNEF